MATYNGEEGVYIQTSFFTKEKRYAIEDTPFSLPVSSTRKDLNQLLNQLLSENNDDKITRSIDFDFLINGTLLRKTLGDLTSSLSLTLENVVQIEYIERNPPPSLENELPHNDWVSAVHCNDNYILSGSYDHNVRIWSHSGKLITKCLGHDSKITDVAWFPRQPSPEGHMTFLSSSHDQHIHIWAFDPNENEESVQLKVVCKGHSRSVEAIAISPSKENCKFVSCSWDKMLKIWSGEIGGTEVNEDEDRQAKRSNTNPSSKPSSRAPVATLAGHTHPIMCMTWADNGVLYSCGYDHCIREWDMSTGVNTNIQNGSKVFLDIDKRPGSPLLVTSHTDKHVRIWDNRTDSPSVISCTLSSHHGWVKRARWSPLSEYQIVSGCYDNAARMWDTRSPKVPLYTMAAHNGKLLCLDWSYQQLIATGGADNMLRTFRVGR